MNRNAMLRIVLFIGLMGVHLFPASGYAEETAGTASEGPWISAVRWVDGERLIASQSQGLLKRPAQVVLASADKPEELTEVGESESSLWSVLPTAENQYVASDYDGAVYLFDKAESKKFESETRWIRTLEAAPTEGEILAGTEDGKLVVLSVASASESRRVDAHEAAIFDIAISHGGDKVATVAGDGSIKIFSWPKLEVLKEMKAGEEIVWTALFTADDKQLVTAGEDRAIQLWNLETGKLVVTISKCSNWVTSLVALPDSSLIAAGSMDGAISVVDYATLHSVTKSKVADSAIWSLAVASDGKRVAVGTRKHGLKIVDSSPWFEAGKQAAEQVARTRPPSP